MVFLQDDLQFPPLETATSDGLLALGGDLCPQRIILAYTLGIFPWFNPGEIIQWWSPDPRFVLFPAELKVSKSMEKVIKRGEFKLLINTSFKSVMEHCMVVKRNAQDGSWISPEVIDAYTLLHLNGYAHSAEAWQDGQLVGGLYGIKLGNVFFGESMFSLLPNASKFAFIEYTRLLRQEGVKIIDCQVYTNHLQSLGARMISRTEFTNYLPGYQAGK